MLQIIYKVAYTLQEITKVFKLHNRKEKCTINYEMINTIKRQLIRIFKLEYLS